MEKNSNEYIDEFNKKYNPHPPTNAKPSLEKKCQHEYHHGGMRISDHWFYCVKCLDIQIKRI